MKKIIILLLSVLFTSCFKEPKKELNINTMTEGKISKSESIDNEILDTVAVEPAIDTTALVSKEIVNTNTELDKIYLGDHLFHQGYGDDFGNAHISKRNGNYYIIGEHKQTNGDWVKIEGFIFNPSIDNFTFKGKISAYSPSSATLENKYKDEETPLYTDECIWEGEAQTIRPEGRRYWRFRNYGCYSHIRDLDLFFATKQ